MATSKYIFKIANDGVTNSPGLHLGDSSAPTLVPINNGGQQINVVRDFPWTNTQGADSARSDVPRITLKEYNVTRSSLYQQSRYLLSSLPDVAQALQQGIQNIGAGKVITAAAVLGATSAGIGKRITGAITGGALAAIANTSVPTTLTNVATKTANKLGLIDKPNTNLKNYLKPYDNLYATKATLFSYILPYFSSDWKNTQINWDSLNSTTYNKFDSALKDINSSITGGGIGGFTGVGSLNSFFPAAYTETPKMFKYTDGSENRLNISFQLFNTTTVDDIIRNFQLCFLLMYQNMPNRASRVLVDVPCIYEANINGIQYMPFAYISKIAITQIGATRKMIIPIAVSNNQEFTIRTVSTTTGLIQTQCRPAGGVVGSSITESSFETLIPDVWEINIELTSLVAESKNLLFQTISNNQSIYDVSILPSTTA